MNCTNKSSSRKFWQNLHNTCINIHALISVCFCLSHYLSVCLSLSLSVCVCVFLSLYIYICVCVCLCVYTMMPVDYVFLLHEYAWPLTSIRRRETITSFKWTSLPHPPNSTDLALSDYRLFGHMKEGSWGKYYASDKEVKTVVMRWIKEQSTEFYKAGIHTLIWRMNITIKKNGDYVEK